MLVSLGCLNGYITDGYFIDIGTPETWRKFECDVLEGRIDGNP